jgi:hypothetical protein
MSVVVDRFTDPDDVYETLTAAADLIERDGWIKRAFWGYPHRVSGGRYEPGMSMCTLGAVRVALGELGGVAWGNCAATRAVQEEILLRAPERTVTDTAGTAIGVDVGGWNDDRNRTQDDVISLLRDVAAKHRPDQYRSAPVGGGA